MPGGVCDDPPPSAAHSWCYRGREELAVCASSAATELWPHVEWSYPLPPDLLKGFFTALPVLRAEWEAVLVSR